ncbi:MAG: YjbH domain-containing protein [Parachlamydiaceae bacterium]|nr:YjbH domain-containing protein [Parachlamydiaceae bacterium]
MTYIIRHYFLRLLTLVILSLNPVLLFSEFCGLNTQENLMRDLVIVNYWNQRGKERLPVMYNNLLQGGYINMPSARMGTEGELGAGYTYVHPYSLYNLRCQLIDRLEVSFNYRVFLGVDDPILTPYGFGDFSDKGANVKFSLFSAEDSQYRLPGVSIGFEDVMGTRAFKSQYIVFSQVFLNYNMELSLGYGMHRIRGFFGGLAWMPFRKFENKYVRNFSIVLEYDATPYWDHHIEKHPDGRESNCRWNYGLKYRIWDSVDLSLSYVRGNSVAFSASSYFNFGATEGIIPKIDDPLPYRAPVNTQSIGYLRPEDVFVQDLNFTLANQGFSLLEAWLSNECDRKTIRMTIVNGVYREERNVRDRLNPILASLIPDDIDQVIITMDTGEFPIQEYRFDMEYVRAYRSQEIGKYELNVLTPLHEISYPNPYESKLLYKKDRDLWNIEILPKTNILFGSAKGKFKYALGLSCNLNGFIYDDVFYSCSFGYFLLSNLYDINDMDRLNPSQLINVRTDIINYYKQKSITIDQAYVQKTTNMGRGWYTSSAIGLFEPEYGGAAGAILYYPVNSSWAIGVEGAILKKRNLEGVGFTNKIRKLEGFKPTYQRFLGKQWFVNIYYDWECAGLDFKISAGKFLADDYGVRYEVSRYYPSGFRLTFWYTHTNAHDIINGHRYQDKGIGFSMPLDIFYTKSSRSRWGYGMSAWLRDIGVKAFTGPELYLLINEQRQ